MSLSTLADFITSVSPVIGLGALKELEIVFSVDQPTPVDMQFGYSEALADVLVFINGSSDILESLSITSYGRINLSPFFQGLRHFRRLIKLSLTIPLDNDHIPDPSALHGVLAHHPGLQYLVIQNRGPRDRATEHWFQQCFGGISFTGLKEFKLGLNPYNFYGVQESKLVSMKSICDTLSSLVLMESCLKFPDLCNVFTSLPTSRLEALSLVAFALSVKVLDLLAESCPNLDKLMLTIQGVDTWDGNHVTWQQGEQGFINTLQNRSRRSCELHNAWKLRDLEIWRWEYGIGIRRQWNLMRAVADCVPSIRSFSGQGNMRESRDI